MNFLRPYVEIDQNGNVLLPILEYNEAKMGGANSAFFKKVKVVESPNRSVYTTYADITYQSEVLDDTVILIEIVSEKRPEFLSELVVKKFSAYFRNLEDFVISRANVSTNLVKKSSLKKMIVDYQIIIDLWDDAQTLFGGTDSTPFPSLMALDDTISILKLGVLLSNRMFTELRDINPIQTEEAIFAEADLIYAKYIKCFTTKLDGSN